MRGRHRRGTARPSPSPPTPSGRERSSISGRRLLVTQHTRREDPLAAGRVTLLGQARKLPEAEVTAARAAYLARHDKARFWVDFEDFAFWRLDLTDAYFVGGFAAMDWVTAEAYQAAAPDPLAEVALSIIDHMNQDHADTCRLYATKLLGAPDGDWRCVGCDPDGLDLQFERTGLRLPFPQRVSQPGVLRAVLKQLADRARAA